MLALIIALVIKINRIRILDQLQNDRNLLVQKHSLYILSAKFGVQEINTTDVTQKVVSKLAIDGKVFVHINPLVGGKKHDPAYGDDKFIYIDYHHNSKLNSKTFKEDSTFSISDLN